MKELSINELLDSVGINQSILAKIMDVSRSTITRMKDNATPEVIEAINKYKDDMTHEQSEAVPVPVVASKEINQDNNSEPVLIVNHRNIALSRIKYGREGVAIDKVAESFGLSVFNYNHAVKHTVSYCNKAGTSFMQLRTE